jgi:hypothetical protein
MRVHPGQLSKLKLHSTMFRTFDCMTQAAVAYQPSYSFSTAICAGGGDKGWYCSFNYHIFHHHSDSRRRTDRFRLHWEPGWLPWGGRRLSHLKPSPSTKFSKSSHSINFNSWLHSIDKVSDWFNCPIATFKPL